MEQKEIIEITNIIEGDIIKGVHYEIPIFHNIDLWFTKEAQNDLSVIRYHLKQLLPGISKDFLSLAFSSIITKVSNQESETRYKSVEKKFKKYEVANSFKLKIVDMINRMNEFSKIASKSDIQVYQKDSTKLDFINSSISVAITSPPYMNSFDYYLYHKHRMNWLDFNFKEVQLNEFGSRNRHNDNNIGAEDYYSCIRKNAEQMRFILKPNGYYCIVVGDSILKGTLIKMNNIFDDIFITCGYKKELEYKFDQRKFTKSFTPKLRTLYKDSYILVYHN